MEANEIFAALQEKFGESVSDFTPADLETPKGAVRDAFCLVTAEELVDVANFLRHDPTLRFDFLQCITGVDYPREEQLHSVYHLYSYALRHQFVIKVVVPRDKPLLPSVVAVWKTADWQEREQYDLLGLQYTGHPDLRRLLMPDDWVGYPMRKDYEEESEYRGMPTTRYSVMDLLKAYDEEHPQTEGERPRIVEVE